MPINTEMKYQGRYLHRESGLLVGVYQCRQVLEEKLVDGSHIQTTIRVDLETECGQQATITELSNNVLKVHTKNGPVLVYREGVPL